MSRKEAASLACDIEQFMRLVDKTMGAKYKRAGAKAMELLEGIKRRANANDIIDSIHRIFPKSPF